MNHELSKRWLSSRPARILVFAWMFVFPVVFIGLPLAKVMTGEGDFTMRTVWAAMVWVLMPLVVTMAFRWICDKSKQLDDVK